MKPAADTPEVDVVEAARQHAEGVVLLDVREPAEWDAGHVASAMHIPLGELGQRYTELAAGSSVLVICRSGARSAEATQAFRGAGYDAFNVAGGMKAWVEAGQPIEPETGFVA